MAWEKGKRETGAQQAGGEEKGQRRTEKGPGENVILVSRVTQGLALPDGALDGLAKAALGRHFQRSTK